MIDPSPSPTTALLVFTDLDGTLLHSETYRYEAVLPTLSHLKGLGIPVIPVTSKTRAEVKTLLAELGLDGPFVVENGSAAFVPGQGTGFPVPLGEEDGSYRVVQWGVAYVMARAGLKAIAQALGRPLKGFGDLSVEQVQQLTGLGTVEAQQAKQREFSEPFLTPKNVSPQQLTAVVEEMGFRVVVGDRFSHLIGAEAGKGVAVQALTEWYRATLPPEMSLVTIGLGNSPNDLAMLTHTDRAIVLPGAQGPHPALADRGWAIAAAPAPAGWAMALNRLLREYGFPPAPQW